MPNPDLLWFIDRALHQLSRDVPLAYDAIQTDAAGLRLALVSDRSAGTVWVTRPVIEVFGPLEDCDIKVRFEETVIIELIDAKLTLTEALSRDLLILTGPQADLVRLISGLQFFLRGAIRSPAIQRLLNQFRDHVGA